MKWLLSYKQRIQFLVLIFAAVFKPDARLLFNFLHCLKFHTDLSYDSYDKSVTLIMPDASILRRKRSSKCISPLSKLLRL